MPFYIFTCFTEDGGCGYSTEVRKSMSQISKFKPKCPRCNSKKTMRQDFNLYNLSVFDGSPKTIGELAHRNSNKKSEDEKHDIMEKTMAYRKQPFVGSLPKDSNLPLRDSKGKIIPSSVQRDKDPRK